MRGSRAISLFAIAVLAAGTFAPIVSDPLFGSHSIAGNSTTNALVLIAIAGSGHAALLLRRRAWALAANVVVCVLLVSTFISTFRQVEAIRTAIAHDPLNAPLQQAVHLGWGWAILFSACSALLVVAVRANNSSHLNEAPTADK